MSLRDEILEKVSTVPTLPIAAVKVIPLLQSSEADLSEIARVISHDPGLTAGILRLVNSSAYAANRPILDVHQAIARLGRRNILGLVTRQALGQRVVQPQKGYDLPLGSLWRHGVAVAYTCESLATLLKRSAAGHTFTAGLLVDVGKTILSESLEVDGEAIAEAAFERGMSFHAAERLVLGIDHAEVGAELLRHWGLPDELVAAVRWHHEPASAPRYRESVDLVHAAEMICISAGIGMGIEGTQYAFDAAVMDRLKLDESIMEQTLTRTLDHLRQAEDILGGRADCSESHV